MDYSYVSSSKELKDRNAIEFFIFVMNRVSSSKELKVLRDCVKIQKSILVSSSKELKVIETLKALQFIRMNINIRFILKGIERCEKLIAVLGDKAFHPQRN